MIFRCLAFRAARPKSPHFVPTGSYGGGLTLGMPGSSERGIPQSASSAPFGTASTVGGSMKVVQLDPLIQDLIFGQVARTGALELELPHFFPY